MNSAALRMSLSGAFVATCFSAAGAFADAPITIVNNLEQPLIFLEISNREHVQIKSDPPAEVPAHSSGKFHVNAGSGNKHLNVKYAVRDTEDTVALVFKHELSTLGKVHCPKDHPDWITEEVRHCGDFLDGQWTYVFSRATD